MIRSTFTPNSARWLQRLDLDARLRILDALARSGRRDVVVGDGERGIRAAHLAAGHAQALEGLRAGHLVDEVAVDIEDAGAVLDARETLKFICRHSGEDRGPAP
jgi:hypothetical protein